MAERTALREAVWASAGILVLIGGVKILQGVVPGWVGSVAITAVWAVQLYGPFLRADRGDVSLAELGLRSDRLRADAGWGLAMAAAITVPYAAGAWWWMGSPSEVALRLPKSWSAGFLLELAVVAVAEEAFFRGYLQSRYDAAWGTVRRIGGAAVGGGLFAASAVFAAAHFAGEWNPARLAPFFPSLLFGWLRARTGAIWGAAGFHAYCNLLQDLVNASFRP
jgi:membrane protease YdiL (CAAX protease family)